MRDTSGDEKSDILEYSSDEQPNCRGSSHGRMHNSQAKGRLSATARQ